MLFQVTLKGTSNGDELAERLNYVANYIKKGNLLEGFKLEFDGGFAQFFAGLQEFDSCAVAERNLEVTLDWRRVNERLIGKFNNVDVAVVYDYPAESR